MSELVKPRSVKAHILRDPAIGECPARTHDFAVDDDQRSYLAENDNHERSSFLWSVLLD